MCVRAHVLVSVVLSVRLLSKRFHICLRCVFGSAPHVINTHGGKLQYVSVLVKTRWIYAADSNLRYFCGDLGITLVRCNLLLVWAPLVAREAVRVCVCCLSVRFACAHVRAFGCLVIWRGVLLCGHALVIKPGLSPHSKPSIMLLDPRRWS